MSKCKHMSMNNPRQARISKSAWFANVFRLHTCPFFSVYVCMVCLCCVFALNSLKCFQNLIIYFRNDLCTAHYHLVPHTHEHTYIDIH